MALPFWNGFDLMGSANPVVGQDPSYMSPPPGTNPMVFGGRVPARWTYQHQQYQQPLLELPHTKFARIVLGMNAWMGEPIINCSSKLTIMMALENMQVTVQSNLDKIPDWIPEEERPKLIRMHGEDPSQLTAAYVKQECLQLAEDLDIRPFMQEVALDLLVAGDGYINIATNAYPAEERYVWEAADRMDQMKRVGELQKQMASDRRGRYDIFALQALNPSAVWLYPDPFSRIVSAKVVHLMGEGTWNVDLNNLIHLKGWGPAWTTYGLSAYIAALKWVNIKFKLMEAMFTSATRYVNPREWISVAGPKGVDGSMLPPTEKQMQWAEAIMGLYAQGALFALPAGWDMKMLGAEGKIVDVDKLLEKADDMIRTAAQVSRTFTSGSANVPAYATSKLQAGVMYKAGTFLQDKIRRVVTGRIFERYCLFRGFFEETGRVIKPNVEFQDMPIQGDDSVEKKLDIMLEHGAISTVTAWELLGMDPSLEQQRMKEAQTQLQEPIKATPPDQAPDQNPSREKADSLALLALARSKGNEKLKSHIDQFFDASFSDDIQNSESLYWQICQYAAEVTALRARPVGMSAEEALQDKDLMDNVSVVSVVAKKKEAA